MTRSWLIVVACLTSLTLLACEPSSPPPRQDGGKCGAGSCLGCCQGNTCVDPPSATACGSFGSACLACPAGLLCGASGSCEFKPAGCEGCAGCCKTGQCYAGGANTSCGTGGVACADCTASGKTCNGATGMCQTGSSGCTGCAGCCKDNQCLGGSADTACGKGGAACLDCSASSKTCNATTGSCESGTTGCTGCGGCCKNNQCLSGTSDSACGQGGDVCIDCAATGKTCNAATGVCQTVSPGCTSCSGCCKNNQCLGGASDSACGKSGAACVDCAATAKTCNVTTGVCEGATPGCTSCSGCCKNNQCLSGTSDTACGQGGAACVDCAASSKTCGASGICEGVTGCGPSNCSTGCCAGGACEQNPSKTACGTNGAACVSCPQSYHQCTGGKCVVDPDSDWQVIAVSATISQAKVWDPWLIGNSELPDPYFGIDIGGCSSLSLSGCGPSVDNTFSPVWNGAVKSMFMTVNFKASELKAQWCAFVGDADGTGACTPPFETMALCSVSVTDQELVQGSKTISSCVNPGDGVTYVTNLQLQLKYAP